MELCGTSEACVRNVRKKWLELGNHLIDGNVIVLVRVLVGILVEFGIGEEGGIKINTVKSAISRLPILFCSDFSGLKFSCKVLKFYFQTYLWIFSLANSLDFYIKFTLANNLTQCLVCIVDFLGYKTLPDFIYYLINFDAIDPLLCLCRSFWR